MTETTTCEAMNTTSCPGAFGFTIDSMGNFTAGPSPSGTTVKGTITPSELSALQTALGPVVESSSTSCTPGASIPGVSAQISASFTDGTQATLYSAAGQICFRGGTSAGTALSNAFHQLLIKYYPNPFPS